MLSFKNITHIYDNEVLIDDFSLDINKKEIITIIGPSGCGKSTLLKLVTKQVELQSGNIINDQKNIGYQSQKDLLLPWLTIYDNIILPLTIKKKDIDPKKINELIKVFDLDNCLNLYPSQISGGMKSRANLLRTFLMSGDLILLDEPFTGLDMITKYRLIDWLDQTLRILGKSVLYITHDIDEAIKISDKIIIVSKGPLKIIKTLEVKDFDKQVILDTLI